MTLKRNGYRKRVAEETLDRYLEAFGAVEIRGPKWCGKTWLALSRAESQARLDDRATREAALIDGRVALSGARPHLIDEWQRVPGTRDLVRMAVDESSLPGSFILTGSSTPKKSSESHSGAGRIARMDLSTMTLLERGLSDGSVSLTSLFEGATIEPRAVDVGLEQVASFTVRGGWPASLGMSDKAAALIPRQYVAAACDPEYLEDDIDADLLRRTLVALARNDGTEASVATLAADASAGEKAIDANEMRRYLSYVMHSYLAYEVGGWEAPVKARARVRTKPKRYLCDPSIAAYLLGTDAHRLMSDTQTLGTLFESLCMHDLIAYANAACELDIAGVHYYRDSYGLEADAVIELTDGRWAALEIKLGANKVDKARESLLRLARKVAENPAARNPEPAFLAVITGVSTLATTVAEGLHVIPVTCLGV
ncbi:MAG: DUF4143 domain-containing protein [Olegusella sp.]|nr:DUF4143 domain-containing protein [Olegusella sp.]